MACATGNGSIYVVNPTLHSLSLVVALTRRTAALRRRRVTPLPCPREVARRAVVTGSSLTTSAARKKTMAKMTSLAAATPLHRLPTAPPPTASVAAGTAPPSPSPASAAVDDEAPWPEVMEAMIHRQAVILKKLRASHFGGDEDDDRQLTPIQRQLERAAVFYGEHPDDLFGNEDAVVQRFGMGQFASPDVPGFEGIFRQRWEDFYVTEMLEREVPVTRQKDFSTPPLPSWLMQAWSPTLSSLEEGVARGDRGAAASTTAVVDDDGIADAVVATAAQQAFFSVTVPEQRRLVDAIDGGGACTTAEGSVAAPTAALTLGGDNDDIADATKKRRSTSLDAPGVGGGGGGGGEFFVECVMHKQHLAHFSATALVAQILRLHPSSISVAGIKDLIGDTVQRIRVKGVSPASLLKVNHVIRKRKEQKTMKPADASLTLSNFSYAREPLKPGYLFGNHFQIVLRDVTASKAHIDTAMRAFEQRGFPNYYGCQRFSWFGGVDDVAFALLHHNWLVFAFRLLNYTERDFSLRALLQRERKYPTPVQDQYRRNVVHCLRRMNLEPTDLDQPLFMTTPKLYDSYTNTGKASDLNPKQQLVVQALRDAFFDLDFGSRRMTAQRLSSFMWNQALSLRLHYFGSEDVLVGDMVVPKEVRQLAFDAENRGAMDSFLTTVTAENKHQFTVEDVVHPAFQFEGSRLPSNDVALFYRQICDKYRLDWGFRHSKRGLKDFIDPPRPIVRRPMDLKYDLDTAQQTLTVEFALERGCYANVAVSELLKLQQCSGSDKILRLPAPASMWARGDRDPGYVTSIQDVYVGFEEGKGFVQDDGIEVQRADGEQEPSLFDWFQQTAQANGGKEPTLFHPDESDPARKAFRWSKRNLVRNMQRRQQDEGRLKRFLFEKPLADTLTDGELAQYAGHHIPLPPSVQGGKKRIFFKVKKRASRFSGAPKFVPRVKLGAQVQNMSKRASYGTLNKGTWNVTW